jgi:hypothetical protein
MDYFLQPLKVAAEMSGSSARFGVRLALEQNPGDICPSASLMDVSRHSRS